MALTEWCGMDSTGLAYEPVAESFEIGNDPSGVTRDGGFPEQQLSEYWLFKNSVVRTNFKKLNTHPSLRGFVLRGFAPRIPTYHSDPSVHRNIKMV